MTKKLFIFTLLLFVVLGMTAAPFAAAQNGSTGPCAGSGSIADCIASIYRWALGVGVLLALIMIIFAGYLYITGGGNAQTVSTAKEYFTGAFIGLIILFAAVLILRTINPELVSFRPMPPLSGNNNTNTNP